jgi:hypothetical protein
MVTSPVYLPTVLVVRYRAVDRERVGSALVDTPRHLDALTSDIEEHGILAPLRLGFNERFGTLDGNHRIAVAIRLGLESVPVALFPEPLTPHPEHAKPMGSEDLAILRSALESAPPR